MRTFRGGFNFADFEFLEITIFFVIKRMSFFCSKSKLALQLRKGVIIEYCICFYLKEIIR